MKILLKLFTLKEYKFSQVHISQFYPRPGTPAARMKKVPSGIVKKRSRELTSVFEAFPTYNGMEGRVERIWITDVATDGVHLVGHTKGYIQVLVVGPDTMLGTSGIVKITSVGRWSVFGEVIETILQNKSPAVSNGISSIEDRCSPCCNSNEACTSSMPLETCVGQAESCASTAFNGDAMLPEDQNSRNLIGWFLRKRKNQAQKKVENKLTTKSKENQDQAHGVMVNGGLLDRVLIGGIFVSFLIIIGVLVHLVFRIQSN